MNSYELSSVITKVGFCISFIANYILIYLTVFHIKKVQGTYKHMIIVFSLFGILFTAMEIVARPFCHNTNQGLFYFSFNTNPESQKILTFVIACWAGFYIQIVAFVAMLFFYRYLCLIHTTTAKKFDGINGSFLICLPWIPGLSYIVIVYSLVLPDQFTDNYFREIILENYHSEVTEFPRISVIPYSSDGQIRWKNFSFLISGGSVTTLNYTVILYCGFKMYFNMKKELNKFSVLHQKLQLQFFKALVAQSIGPSLFLVLPIAPILLSPLIPPMIEIDIDWQTGWFFSLIGAYSPFDSIAFMFIVTEYKSVMRKQLTRFFGSKDQTSSVSMSSEVVTRKRKTILTT